MAIIQVVPFVGHRKNPFPHLLPGSGIYLGVDIALHPSKALIKKANGYET